MSNEQVGLSFASSYKNLCLLSLTMASTNLDKSPEDLYRDGFFQQAASNFCCLARKRSRAEMTSPSEKVELQRLAWEADAALCEVRSCTVQDTKKFVSMCKRAIDSNRRYSRALFDILDTLKSEWKSGHSRKKQRTLEAILLAAVAASWLYLQMPDHRMALDILVEDLRLILTTSQSTCKLLLPLVEMLHRLEANVTTTCGALREFRHTLDVVCAMNGICSNRIDGQASEFTSLIEQPTTDASATRLRVRQFLLRALLTHKQQKQAESGLLSMNRCRDVSLEKAWALEPSFVEASDGLARRVRTVVRAVDMTVNANCDPLKKAEVISLADELESFLGRTPVFASLWNLLGCLRATYDAERALKAFDRAYKLDPSSRGTLG
jgi:tetratricopeptide (TPR) repeat protein